MEGFPREKSRADMMQMAYKKIKWDSINKLDQVSSILMGDVSYWGSNEFSTLEPIEVELDILRKVDQYKWHEEQPYGKPMWEHLCCLMKLLNPGKTDILPGLYDTTQAFCILFGTGGKTLNQLGARSMSKTGGNVRLMNALMHAKPNETMLFINCPYKDAADSTAWGDFKGIANDANKNHPHIFPDFTSYSKQKIQYVKNLGKFGFAQVRTMAEVGNYRGTKGAEDGQGFIIIYNDEINAHPRSAYSEVEENVTSNRQFMFWNSWNWQRDDDMGGIISRPDPVRSGKNDHSDLDIDLDQCYDSIGGMTLRFDGKYSLNMLVGKKLTPYTFFNKVDDWDYLIERYTETSPQFLSQGRAFPSTGDYFETVLPRKVLESSRYKDMYTIRATPTADDKTAFLDPAFGGDDSAQFSCGVTQDIYYYDGGNEKIPSRVFSPLDYIRELKLTNDAIWNDYWLEKAEKAGCIMTQIKPNSVITFSEQQVVQVCEKLKQFGIPWKNYGYDSSMDDSIVIAHNKLMGFEPVSYNYKLKPHGVMIPHLKQMSNDVCYNIRDEVFFMGASYFYSQIIRDGSSIGVALEDLCSTRYEMRGSKRKVEDKAEFKSRKNGRSPDKLDALLGNLDMARKRSDLIPRNMLPQRKKYVKGRTASRRKNRRTGMKF